MASLCLGNTLARRLAGSYLPTIPWCILPDGPPNTRGPLEVLVGPFTDFSDFLGRLLVIVEFYSRDYLFTYMFFFQNSSKFTGILTNITSTFADNRRIDRM